MSSLATADFRLRPARKIPDSPPARNSAMKPSANSIEVLSRKRALQSVPSQLRRRIVAGKPSDEARTEKTSGEKGFNPLENMCWPHTQKPTRPTPQSAKTTRRSFQAGFRENVAMRCVTMPKHGSIATYTWACAKNQKRRCQSRGRESVTRFAGCEARKFATVKKCVAKKRSDSTQTHAAKRMLKIRRLRIALTNQAQTVSGSRGRVIPCARKSRVVTVKFSAVQREAPQNTDTQTIQSVIPVSGASKNAVVIPNNETTVAHKQQRLSTGKAISGAPICSGSR